MGAIHGKSSGGSGVGGTSDGVWHDQGETPTGGQTAFTLDFLPTNNNSVFMIVNGQTFTPGKGFIISGTSITWDESFAISETDVIVLRYKKSA